MKAKRAGRKARIVDDLPIEACPYDHPSFMRVYWRAAWMKADKEMCRLGWPSGSSKAFKEKNRK